MTDGAKPSAERVRYRVQDPEELADTLLGLTGEDIRQRAAAILRGWPTEDGMCDGRDVCFADAEERTAEDADDIRAIAERKGEPSVPWDEVRARLDASDRAPVPASVPGVVCCSACDRGMRVHGVDECSQCGRVFPPMDAALWRIVRSESTSERCKLAIQYENHQAEALGMRCAAWEHREP